MEEKLKKIKGGWISDQIKLINALTEQTDTLKPLFKDKKKAEEMSDKEKQSFTLLTILEGHKGALVFRLKNALHLIKELSAEEIKLPENIETLIKSMTDTISLNKDGDVVDEQKNNYTKLIQKFK